MEEQPGDGRGQGEGTNSRFPFPKERDREVRGSRLAGTDGKARGGPDFPHPQACESWDRVLGELMVEQGQVCYQGPWNSWEKGDTSSTADDHVCTHG